MLKYIFRRILYAIPILLTVNVITFVLFFVVNSPDDMARLHLGHKHVTQEAINKWKTDRGYEKSLLWDSESNGVGKVRDTIFYDHTVKLFLFEFGQSDSGRDIGFDISQRMWPSLAIALPVLTVGLMVTITFALIISFFRATYIDTVGVIVCVIMMSISGLFYIIGGQYLVGKLFRLVPISGYEEGLISIKFVILPVIIGVLSGIGNGTRWYRTIFLEEINKDYVRTARAKGLSDAVVMYGHVLRNAMIPIITILSFSFAGILGGAFITETILGIPGIGRFSVEAIFNRDYPVIMAITLVSAVAFIFANLLADISYSIIDPRIRYK